MRPVEPAVLDERPAQLVRLARASNSLSTLQASQVSSVRCYMPDLTTHQLGREDRLAPLRLLGKLAEDELLSSRNGMHADSRAGSVGPGLLTGVSAKSN